MAFKVSEEVIERVRTQADIVEVISEYVPLKKKGVDFWGLCPFHEEKTPSFKVSPTRQFFHCFGCGKGGSVFTFLMAHDNLSFSEALRAVAGRVGVVIPETQSSGKGADFACERLFRMNAFALEHFNENLQGNQGTKARRYLDERGISSKTAELFGLGYALPQWDGLVKAAQEAGIVPGQLSDAGLAKAGERGGFYDRFRDRLMFPIYTLNGDGVAFGGRTLAGEDAKYINSSESLIYKKGDILYGLHLAKKHVQKANRVILVEGYFDLISLWQAGIENIVATCGTALTHAQAKLMRRYAEEVIILYDSDEAGLKASQRATEALISTGLKVKVATLSGGADPDEYLRTAGVTELVKRLDEGADFLDFFVIQRREKGLLERIEDRISAARDVVEIVKHAPDELIRDAYLKCISEKLDVDEALLRKQAGSKSDRARARTSTEPTVADKIPLREKSLIKTVVSNPEHLDFVKSRLSPDYFSSDVGREILTTLYGFPRAAFGPAEVFERLRSDEARDAFGRIMAEEHAISEVNELEEYVESFLRSRRKTEVKRFSQEQKAAELSGDDQRVKELLMERYKHRRSAEEKI